MGSTSPPTEPLPQPGPPTRAGLGESTFFGHHGLRVGWRLLLFVFLLALLYVAGSPLLSVGLQAVATPSTELTPSLLLVGEGWLVLVLFIATWVMAFIEKRRFADYGLPWREVFRGRFWEGAVWGLVSLSVLVGALAAAGVLTLGNGGFAVGTMVEQGILWGAGFLLVGFFEEFCFRGYGLKTLAESFGFWPAAVAFSVIFGLVHLSNSGETHLGIALVFAYGLMLCLALRRTGSLWFAIGLHAAWDWAETFLYGVPDSGQLASSHLLTSHSRGPAWLSGGTAGPEGSVLALAMMLILWFAITFRFRAARFPAPATQKSGETTP